MLQSQSEIVDHFLKIWISFIWRNNWITFTTQRIVGLHVPVEWFTLVANTTLDSLFALAELTFGYGSTAGESLNDSSRITVTIYVK